VSALSDSERPGPPAVDPWNALQWRPESRRPHVESLFLELFVPDHRQAFWVQFGARTFTNGAAPAAHVMAVRFDASQPGRNVAVKQLFPASAVIAARDRLDVHAADCHLEPGRTRGALARDGHTVSWDLTWDATQDALYHLPWPLLYRLPLPKTKATSPAPDTRFHGWFEVDGERVPVRRCPGMQGHNWGREHAWRWAWVHGNQFTGSRPEAAEAMFEGLSARVRLVAGVRTPWMSVVALRYGNLALRFDSLRHPLAITSEPVGLSWQFAAGDARNRVRGRAIALPERFVAVHYPNPDGRLAWCNNSSTAGLELTIEENVRSRWQVVDVLRAAESAALEIAGPGPVPGVPLLLPAETGR
jgi:hypothetical protein